MEEYRFEAPVIEDPEEVDFYRHVVWVPPPIAEAVQEGGHRRFVGTIGGIDYRRALHRAGDRTCISFGKVWLRNAELPIGEPLEVTIAPDPDPDYVDVPEELKAALELEPMAVEEWERLTPGKQRSYAYKVKRGKKPETRVNRALKISEDLRADAYTRRRRGDG